MGSKDDGRAVSSQSAAGSRFRAAEPRGYSPGSRLSPRIGSLPGPPELRRAVCNSPGG